MKTDVDYKAQQDNDTKTKQNKKETKNGFIF
jgi:hypothetical protein